MRIEIDAPAKVNLSLRVLRRREDGFHEIESLMVRLPGLCDRLVVEESAEDVFECDAPGVPTDAGNLAVKAREVFRAATGIDTAVRMRLEKVIPHGAGLAGGSSDAAAALVALNRCFNAGLAPQRLIELGAMIGSDVPFFLGPPVARVRGRGEILEEAEALPPLRLVLLKPSFGVSTPEAYGRWKDAPGMPGLTDLEQRFEWGGLVNDLERPVFSKHLFLAEMKAWLLRQDEAAGALMSGSGSTMFAVLRDGVEGGSLIARARRELDPTLWSWEGAVGA